VGSGCAVSGTVRATGEEICFFVACVSCTLLRSVDVLVYLAVENAISCITCYSHTLEYLDHVCMSQVGIGQRCCCHLSSPTTLEPHLDSHPHFPSCSLASSNPFPPHAKISQRIYLVYISLLHPHSDSPPRPISSDTATSVVCASNMTFRLHQVRFCFRFLLLFLLASSSSVCYQLVSQSMAVSLRGRLRLVLCFTVRSNPIFYNPQNCYSTDACQLCRVCCEVLDLRLSVQETLGCLLCITIRRLAQVHIAASFACYAVSAQK
jgi:hypothetical protein